MGEIGEKIEAAIAAAVEKHFKDGEIAWPLRVEGHDRRHHLAGTQLRASA
jgi:hypothetical protein